MDALLCVGISILEVVLYNLNSPNFRSPISVANLTSDGHHYVFGGLVLVQYLVLKYYRIFIYPWYFSPLRHLPTPTDNTIFFGQALNFIKGETPTALYEKWMREWPDAPLIRYITILGKEVVFCNSPDANKDVLQTHCYDLHKAPTWSRIINDFARGGLATLEGEQHRQHRKILNNSFSPGNVRELLPNMRKAAEETSRVMESTITANDGQTGIFDCTQTFSKATLDIIVMAIVGVDISVLVSAGEDRYSFDEAYRAIFTPDILGKLLMFSNAHVPVRWLPLKANREWKKACTFVKSKLREVVRERRREIFEAFSSGKYKRGEFQDILSFIAEESLPGGGAEGLGEEALAGHILQLVSAGHDTSANCLAWSTYIMATKPAVQDALRSEILELLARSPSPTSAEMESLHYLTNFIKESLRCYSPTTTSHRMTGADLMIDGVLVPKGTTIDMAADIPQHNPLIWGEDAMEFDPTRWDRLTGAQLDPYAFGVFSNGPRICIGRSLAWLELRVILIEVVSKFRFLKVEGSFTLDNPSLVLKPNGLTVRLEKI